MEPHPNRVDLTFLVSCPPFLGDFRYSGFLMSWGKKLRYMRGPLTPTGSGKPLSADELASCREQLEKLKASVDPAGLQNHGIDITGLFQGDVWALGIVRRGKTHVFLYIPSWKRTWHGKIGIFHRKYIHLHSWWIFHCQVSFRGCTALTWRQFATLRPAPLWTSRYFTKKLWAKKVCKTVSFGCFRGVNPSYLKGRVWIAGTREEFHGWGAAKNPTVGKKPTQGSRMAGFVMCKPQGPKEPWYRAIAPSFFGIRGAWWWMPRSVFFQGKQVNKQTQGMEENLLGRQPAPH